MKKTTLAFVVLLLASSASAESFNFGTLPETMTAPAPRPEIGLTQDTAPVPDATMPAEELACRKRLEAAGVGFRDQAPLDDPLGCAAPWPLTVTHLPGNVALRPEATLTCAMAEATASFVEKQAQGIARQSFGSPIVALDQVSAYVCRPRTSDAAKLSEHAFANALDWGTIELEDGSRIDIRHYGAPDSRDALLMARLRKAACGPFKTVLGPGSDADHSNHFHFDLAQRRNGGTWCR